MNKFLKRLLAVSLSAALLIGCAVSGLVLPAAAETTPESSAPTNLFPGGDFDAAFSAAVTYGSGVSINQKAGVDGTPGLEIASGASTSGSGKITINFTTPLKAGKYYIFRAKFKGGADNAFYLWCDLLSTTQALRSNTEYVEVQTIFCPTTDLKTLSAFLINKSANPGYVDDIRIYEYVPGMNVYPNEWEYTQTPYLYTSTSDSNIFQSMPNYSYTKESEESTNYVHKFDAKYTQLKFGLISKFLTTSSSGVVVPGIIDKEQPFLFSFRYKGESADATFNIALAADKGGAILRQSSTAADENGWKTYTALLSFSLYDPNWQYIASIGKTTTLMVDDVFLGEATEVDITTADQDLKIGESLQLAYSVLPLDSQITWTSSNPKVAMVDANGKVTALSFGTTEITATILDGVTDTFNVKVVSSCNLITNGDLEGAEWKNASKYIRTVDNNTVLATNHYSEGSFPYISLPKNLQLSKPFEEGKYYIFRMKVKGGPGQMYDYAARGYGTISTSTAAPKSENEWYSHQFVFTPHASDVGKTTFSGWYYYNTRSDAKTEGSYVYYDDFELYEYSLDMNILEYGVANGEVIPTCIWPSYSSEYMELDTIDGNSVIKIKDGHTTSGTYFNLAQYSKIIQKNVPYTFSFRYKTEGDESKIKYWLASDKAIQNSLVREDDPNNPGWKILTLTFTLVDTYSFSAPFACYFPGVDTWVDDISLMRTSSIDITTADANLKLDGMLQLEYNVVYPTTDYTIKWVSSDSTVATVDIAGRVIAKGFGEATITALLPSGASDTFTVNITEYHNLITNGDFETVSNSHIVDKEGYGGGKAFFMDPPSITDGVKAATSGVGMGITFKLSEPLDPNKTYVFRYKSRGGMSGLYAGGTASFISLNPYDWKATTTEAQAVNFRANEAMVLGNTNEWFQYQTAPFSPSSAITEFSGVTAYSYRANTGRVYYDDFEIIEYKPGFNLIPGSDGELLPGAFRSPNHLFAGFLNYGLTADEKKSIHTTMVTDKQALGEDLLATGMKINLVTEENGNKVWKFSNVIGSMQTRFYAENLLYNRFGAGETLEFSIRYKSAGTITFDASQYSKVDAKTVTGTDGWKTYSGTITGVIAADGKCNLSYLFYMTIKGASEFLVDDFYISESLENYEMKTVDTSVHQRKDGTIDGVRFKTRLNFGDELKVSEETGLLQVAYNGVYYDVIRMGALLKRSTNEAELTLENAADQTLPGSTRVFKAEAYNSTENVLKCVAQGDTYVEMAVNMMTSNPSETFENRKYDGRGYIQLNIDGKVVTFYTNTYTDSAIAAYNRYVASLAA